MARNPRAGRLETRTARLRSLPAYKIALRDIPGAPGEDGFHAADVNDLLDRIRIGPSGSAFQWRCWGIA